MRKLLLSIPLMFCVGCIHYDYAFDPVEFSQSFGEPGNMDVKDVPCMTSPAECAQLQPFVPSLTVSCDPNSKYCTANAEFRTAQTVDLRSAKTSVPDAVINSSSISVSIQKIAYWLPANTLNFPTPPVDIYVGPASANDERDSGVTKLGSVASLPAGSRACGDTADTSDPAAKQGQMVCDMMITADGNKALSGFLKAFKTAPFKIFAHALYEAPRGSKIPGGAITVDVRPTVRFSL